MKCHLNVLLDQLITGAPPQAPAPADSVTESVAPAVEPPPPCDTPVRSISMASAGVRRIQTNATASRPPAPSVMAEYSSVDRTTNARRPGPPGTLATGFDTSQIEHDALGHGHRGQKQHQRDQDDHGIAAGIHFRPLPSTNRTPTIDASSRVHFSLSPSARLASAVEGTTPAGSWAAHATSRRAPLVRSRW